jgi:hypothetical protein
VFGAADGAQEFTEFANPAGYRLRLVMLDPQLNPIGTPDSTDTPLKPGADVFWNPQCTGPTLTVVQTALPNGAVGVPYSTTLSATGGSGALVWTLQGGGLPAGLSLSGAGVISGTPATAGSSTFTVRVTSAATTALGTFTIGIAADPWIGSFAGTIDYTRPIDNHGTSTGSITRNTSPLLPSYNFSFREIGGLRWSCFFEVVGGAAVLPTICTGGSGFFHLTVGSGSITPGAVTLSLISPVPGASFTLAFVKVPNP